MLTPPTAAEFKSKFSEFSATQDADVDSVVALAIQINSRSLEIVNYLTAHLLTLRAEDTGKIDGGSGEVTMEGIGPKQSSYLAQAQNNSEVFFSRSSYGRMYLTLCKSHPSAMTVKVFG